MKIYDLIDKGNYIQAFNAGVLEETFNLSLSTHETIQCVKVKSKSPDSSVIILRYSWTPETEHINHTAEKYERFISENYERISAWE